MGDLACQNPVDIECRPVGGAVEDFEKYKEWQVVSCDTDQGLLCEGSKQTVHPVCEDYEVRVLCCSSSGGDKEVINIERRVNDLIDEIEEGGLSDGEIENLDEKVKQEVDSHENFKESVEAGLKELPDEDEIPEKLQNSINEMLESLEEEVEDDISGEEKQAAKIKNAMEKLATKSEGKMKAVVDKTVENLSNLKQDESKLLNENEKLLETLEEFENN